MTPEDYQKIRSIFSEEGMSEKWVNIKAENDLKVSISCEEDFVDMDFTESDKLPELSIRIIGVGIEGVTLDKKGGKLKLKSLPDIPFLYKWINK